MWNDFDDDDNQWDDGDEEDFRKEQDRINKHPLMQKANDIMLLTETLVGVLDEGAKEMYGTFMLEDATVICGKFGGAEGVDDYIPEFDFKTGLFG